MVEVYGRPVAAASSGPSCPTGTFPHTLTPGPRGAAREGARVSDQAKDGRNGFDVYSADNPSSERPKDGPAPGKNNSYEWTDDLSEGGPNGDSIGTAHFEGTMQDDTHFSCSGTVDLNGGSGWT